MISRSNPWLVLAIVSGALTMVGIDMTVLNVALPTLSHDLGATTAEKLWMVNAYSLMMAGLLPGFGALADKIGHRTILMIGLAVFGIASTAAAFSMSPEMLIAARAALGAGAAMMLPATLSTVRIMFRDDDQRALAIGIWGSVWAGSGAIGPVFGGFLLEHFPWGAVFLINVPLVIVTFALMATLVPHLPGDAGKRWDIPTSLMLTLMLVGLIYGAKSLLKAQIHWGEAIGAFGFGAAAYWAFARCQRNQADPLVDLSLFRNVHLSLGAGCALIAAFVLMGLQYALAQELQLVRGLSPLNAGLFVLPVAIGSFIAGPLLGRLASSIGLNRLLLLSILTGTAGMIAYALAVHGSGGMAEACVLALIGLGVGGTMSIASTLIMLGAPEERAGQAGAIESLSYEVGGTMGVAVMGSMMGAAYARGFAPPAGARVPPGAWDSFDQMLLALQGLPSPVAQGVLSAGRAAFLHGMLMTLVLASIAMAAMLIAAAMVIARAGSSSFTTSS